VAFSTTWTKEHIVAFIDSISWWVFFALWPYQKHHKLWLLGIWTVCWENWIEAEMDWEILLMYPSFRILCCLETLPEVQRSVWIPRPHTLIPEWQARQNRNKRYHLLAACNLWNIQWMGAWTPSLSATAFGSAKQQITRWAVWNLTIPKHHTFCVFSEWSDYSIGLFLRAGIQSRYSWLGCDHRVTGTKGRELPCGPAVLASKTVEDCVAHKPLKGLFLVLFLHDGISRKYL
jgi:hypothetical protein